MISSDASDAEVLSQVNAVMMVFDYDDRAGDDDDHHHCHHQGFDDTLRFLQKRYMISCTRCLAVASTYEIEDEMDEEEWEVILMVMLVMLVMMGMMAMVVKDNQIQKPHQVLVSGWKK